MPQQPVSVTRPRGRPRVDSPRSTSVTTWLDPREADKLIRLASRSEKSVSELVRTIIQHRLGK